MMKPFDDATLQTYLQLPAATTLLDLNFGFARARILDTALELRLFTFIDQGYATATSLASTTQCSMSGMERLLEALVGVQLLCQQQDHYILTPLAATYLVEGQPGYIGEHLRDVMRQWNAWESLTEVVRSGQGKYDIASPGQRGHHPGQFASVFPVMFPTAWQVAGMLELGQGRVLDLAAGSGAWGIALALRHPQVQVVIQDELELLEVSQHMIERFALQDRMTVRPAYVDDLAFPPASFDLILLGHTCRFLGEEKSQELICACYRLLKPRGMLLLADIMRNDEHTGPPFVLVIQLSLLLNTRAGDVFTPSQYRAWLRMAGFQQIKNLAVQQGTILLASR
jgi:ubiquinone/menaquinone biosynthesis C-methylase UbiE